MCAGLDDMHLVGFITCDLDQNNASPSTKFVVMYVKNKK